MVASDVEIGINMALEEALNLVPSSNGKEKDNEFDFNLDFASSRRR
ncbi:hypothetical protein ACFL2Q_08235 [Thermodesulfobacteriota bacterium]